MKFSKIKSIALLSVVQLISSLTLASQLNGATNLGDTSQPTPFLVDGVVEDCGGSRFPFMMVFKARGFQQVGPVLTPGSIEPEFFCGGVSLAGGPTSRTDAITTISSAYIKGPACSGLQPWLTQDHTNHLILAIENPLGQEIIDKIMPAGEYYFGMTAGGASASTKSILPSQHWPKTPSIANYDAAQSIDASQNFTLQLNGDQVNARTYITIADKATGETIFGDYPPCIEPASNLQWVLTAGMLQPNRNYHIEIESWVTYHFQLPSDKPGLCFRVLAKTTSTLKTIAGPASLVFTQQPLDQNVSSGTSVTFSCAASTPPGAIYQWHKNGTKIEGANQPALILPKATAADAGLYWVTINANGGSITSRQAKLNVNSSPIITLQPVAQLVVLNKAVTLSVQLEDSANAKYQWRKDGKSIQGATKSTYTIRKFATTDVGNYSVDISNPFGKTKSQTARMAVLEPPQIVRQPQKTTVSKGGTAIFSVDVRGSGSLTFRWYKGNSPLANGSRVSGATSRQLQIINCQSTDAGEYRVVVKNAADDTSSKSATLTVRK